MSGEVTEGQMGCERLRVWKGGRMLTRTELFSTLRTQDGTFSFCRDDHHSEALVERGRRVGLLQEALARKNVPRKARGTKR